VRKLLAWPRRELALLVMTIAALVAGPHLLAADGSTPEGLWEQRDDQTGIVRSHIRIEETEGTYTGVVERIFTFPGEPTDPICEWCEGDLKGARILGLDVIRGMRPTPEGYGGGQVVDPLRGRAYSGIMRLSDDGQQLEVRGYVGIPSLGESQFWQRIE
jgi:uncharacterized protein (DUF2147 family)